VEEVAGFVLVLDSAATPTRHGRRQARADGVEGTVRDLEPVREVGTEVQAGGPQNSRTKVAAEEGQ
jgi:hypothetical protein